MVDIVAALHVDAVTLHLHQDELTALHLQADAAIQVVAVVVVAIQVVAAVAVASLEVVTAASRAAATVVAVASRAVVAAVAVAMEAVDKHKCVRTVM